MCDSGVIYLASTLLLKGNQVNIPEPAEDILAVTQTNTETSVETPGRVIFSC